MLNIMKKNHFPKITVFQSAIFIIGVSTVIAQICFMRELLAVFHGNEISVGIILFGWLIFTSAGAALAGVRPTYIPSSGFLAAVLSMFACSLPLSLIIIRSGRRLLGLLPGETAGFGSLVLLTASALGPVCVLAGSLYTITCRAAHAEAHDMIAAPRIYVAETAGSCIGGLIFSVLLITLVPVPQMILALTVLNFAAALRCLPRRIGSTYRPRFTAAAGMVSATVVFWFLTVSGGNLLNRTPGIGLTLISKDTPYSRITVKQLGSQYTFYQNGIVSFTVPGRIGAEETVHIPLLEHPHPEKILLLGGSLSGSIREALQHPGIRRLDYIEQDPELPAIAREVLPESETNILNNPVVHLHHIDARRYVKQTSIRYDVIISNLPPPATAGLNRFYTLEFFQEINHILGRDGLFSLSVPSSENALSNEQAELLAIIHATLHTVFPDVIMIPGEPIRLIAANKDHYLTADPDTLIQRLKRRNLQTKYIREYYLPYQLSLDRRDALQKRLHSIITREYNRDFKPMGYFVYTLLFSTYFPAYYQNLLSYVRPLTSLLPIMILGIAALAAAVLVSLKKSSPDNAAKTGIYLSVLSVGFTEISLEFILILGFQVLYGSAYQELAVIIAGYMLGLMLGSASVTAGKGLFSRQSDLHRFITFQLLMGLFPLVLLFVLLLLADSGATLPAGPLLSSVFGLLTLAAGYIGGVQFPLANLILFSVNGAGPKTAGALYSTDLAGSAAGALITAVLLIPLLGISTVLALLAAGNLLLWLYIRGISR